MLLVDFIYRQFNHSPPAPTASFKGRTAIVTGGNSGSGLEACRWMIGLGASQIIIACRNVEKGKTAARYLQELTECAQDAIQVWQLDMSSYKSIQAFADKAKAELPQVDALLLNAGMGTYKFKMSDDCEETIQTNVVSITLLELLLHPKLHETAINLDTETHITVTGSELYELAKFKESKAFTRGFCQSNLFADDYDGFVVHLIKKMLARPTEVGAQTLAYSASLGPESHGQYVPDCKITQTKGLTRGEAGTQLQNRFWSELSAKLETIHPGVTSIS